ncbi:MAG: hypothetical protein HXS48_16210 [Theionarchaea archaeon]|nr:hypothetical protein [Theionarchaea archaeon]
MVGNEVKGLYFPYADIRSATTLKTAILYFDRIAVVDPRASFCGKSIRFDHLGHEMNTYMRKIHTLVEEKIIELIDPTEVISRFGKEIMDGIIQDLYDTDFLNLCEPFVDLPWVLSSAKLPSDDADKWLRNILVNVPTLARGSTMHDTWKEYSWFFKESGPYFRELALRGYYEERKRGRYSNEEISHRLRERLFDEYRMVMLPFPIGESIMIGHVLAIAADRRFIPFCDEKIHLDTLKARIRRHSDSEMFKTVLHEYGYLKDVKAGMLAQDVINETIPSLERVPIETILRFRKEKADELENFRIEMRKLVTEIESNPWDSDFAAYINDIIDSTVNPALREIKNEIRGCKDSFWADAVKTFATVSPLPIVGSIFSGIPEHIALGIGASLGGLALILDQWAKERRVKRNGFALLIEGGQRFKSY